MTQLTNNPAMFAYNILHFCGFLIKFTGALKCQKLVHWTNAIAMEMSHSYKPVKKGKNLFFLQFLGSFNFFPVLGILGNDQQVSLNFDTKVLNHSHAECPKYW